MIEFLLGVAAGVVVSAFAGAAFLPGVREWVMRLIRR